MTTPEGDLAWERSRRCDTNTCVEVAPDLSDEKVYVRDGKDPEGAIVTFPAADWEEFLEEVAAGKHQPSAWGLS